MLCVVYRIQLKLYVQVNNNSPCNSETVASLKETHMSWILHWQRVVAFMTKVLQRLF